jgi:hypothetical protein
MNFMLTAVGTFCCLIVALGSGCTRNHGSKEPQVVGGLSCVVSASKDTYVTHRPWDQSAAPVLMVQFANRGTDKINLLYQPDLRSWLPEAQKGDQMLETGENPSSSFLQARVRGPDGLPRMRELSYGRLPPPRLKSIEPGQSLSFVVSLHDYNLSEEGTYEVAVHYCVTEDTAKELLGRFYDKTSKFWTGEVHSNTIRLRMVSDTKTPK